MVAAAICTVLSLFINLTTASGSGLLSTVTGIGSPGRPLTMSTGTLGLSTGVVEADLSNGANGPVNLSLGLCIPELKITCTGVLSEYSLKADFKDEAGNLLYSDAAPAAVSWTCNATTCPPTPSFVPGSSTVTQLQIAEFSKHTMYVSLRNPDGTYAPFAPAPACNGVSGSPLPTGTIDPQDTNGVQFCVDVGAISRSGQVCQTVCSSWSGALKMPVLFVEDPRFMGS